MTKEELIKENIELNQRLVRVHQQKQVAAFRVMGLTEAEAKIAAGIYDEQFMEMAAKRGDARAGLLALIEKEPK
jgi:hypothetical protein